MSSASDPALLTLAEARREILARRLSAVELTEAVLVRIERLDQEIGAYVHLDPGDALAQARLADRRDDDCPLKGIPICVKDVIDVAGTPTTAGAAHWRRSPRRDADAVARLRAAGAVLAGKGHTNEFAYGIDGKNPHTGNCHNPYDHTRITGGSSSGPAAATAAGMAMAGLGTDTSGSIRVPASLCGLVGVRPTLGLVPTTGVVPLAWSYDAVGPLTRTVADAAIVLAVLIGGPVGGGSAGSQTGHDHDLRGRRIGVMEQLLEVVEPYVEAEVRRTARDLEDLGAEVVPLQFELLRHVTAMHLLVQHAEAAQVHKPWFEAERDHYSEPVRVRLEAGRLLPASDYLGAQQARRLFINEVATKLDQLDAMLAPSTAVIAPPQDDDEVTIRGARRDLRAGLLQCALPASQLACPVVAVPIGAHDGMPFGVQIIGRPFSEESLLSIAAACERGSRWKAPALGEASRPSSGSTSDA